MKIPVTLLVMVMKLLIKIYIGKEGFISDHSLRMQTIMAGRGPGTPTARGEAEGGILLTSQ